MRRQTRSASSGPDEGLEKATATPIKIEPVHSAAPAGSSSPRAKATEGTSLTASQTTTSSQRGAKGTKRFGAVTETSGRDIRRSVKQEFKANEPKDPTPALSEELTAKRRRTRAQQEDLEPTKDEEGKSIAAATERIKRVGAGSKSKGGNEGKNSKNKKVRSKKGRENGRAEEDASARNVRIPSRMVEKASLIVQVMDALYPDPPIPLNHANSFTLLCAVLLSAQTTDGQVNEVTKELFRVAPEPDSLSKMSQAQVQHIIRSVGLAPTKARHLIALSQQLVDRFGGQVPGTFEGLQSLPGVGRKTAAVVMAQAFGMPAFPVDTHIHRLALRWGLTKNQTNTSRVEEDLMALFPRELWCKLHLQFIYFGREHCQARAHEALACPVCSWINKTGPSAPRSLSDLACLRKFLASPTPPKKSNKNAIIYQERLLEMDQFKMKMEA